jgi:hypothetical protein
VYRIRQAAMRQGVGCQQVAELVVQAWVRLWNPRQQDGPQYQR